MNIKDINEYFNDYYDDAEVVFGDNAMDIYINGRHSVTIENIEKADVPDIAQELLRKFDFSFRLEFDNVEEAYQFLK